MRVHAVCSLCAGIKKRFPLATDTATWYQHTYSMLATNQYDIANWFMYARVSVRT